MNPAIEKLEKDTKIYAVEGIDPDTAVQLCGALKACVEALEAQSKLTYLDEQRHRRLFRCCDSLTAIGHDPDCKVIATLYLVNRAMGVSQ